MSTCYKILPAFALKVAVTDFVHKKNLKSKLKNVYT